MKEITDWIIFDGRLTTAEEPVVPVTSRGLMYGDGAFETFPIYKNKSFQLKEHVQRLKEALHVLGISAPPLKMIQDLEALVHQLLRKKELLGVNAITRLQVWRDGKRGYSIDTKAASHFSIVISECPKNFEPPALATVERKRIPSEALPSQYKFTNGINYILAAREAAKKDADDALMQTLMGYVSETTIANIFWFKKDTVFTPSVTCDIIPGITRRIIIDLIEQKGTLEIEKGEYPLSHLLDADGAWISNSVRELLPVKAIDGTSFKSEHPIIQRLQQDFINFRNNNLKALTG